jgi:hypothetical protein
MPEEHPVLDLIFRRAVTAERRSRALADGRFLNRDLQDHRRRAIGNTVIWRGLSRLTDIALEPWSEWKLWVIESRCSVSIVRRNDQITLFAPPVDGLVG